MNAGALRRLALLAAMVLAMVGIAAPAGAAEPLGSRNFTAPRYAPDYFSNESGPFHTVPAAPQYAAPQRYAAPAAPRYYAAPAAASASARGVSEARYRRAHDRTAAGHAVRHAERRRVHYRASAHTARRISHVRARRHVHHSYRRRAAAGRAVLHAAHAPRRRAAHATAHHPRIADTAGRNTDGRL